MTTRPELRIGPHLLPGLIAVALFGVFVLAILRSSFGDPAGFPEDASIVANIGFALLDIDAGGVPTEGFLVAFIAIALVLDAALDGAVMLAREEPDRAVETDGGNPADGGESDAARTDDGESDAARTDGGESDVARMDGGETVDPRAVSGDGGDSR